MVFPEHWSGKKVSSTIIQSKASTKHQNGKGLAAAISFCVHTIRHKIRNDRIEKLVISQDWKNTKKVIQSATLKRERFIGIWVYLEARTVGSLPVVFHQKVNENLTLCYLCFLSSILLLLGYLPQFIFCFYQ